MELGNTTRRSLHPRIIRCTRDIRQARFFTLLSLYLQHTAPTALTHKTQARDVVSRHHRFIHKVVIQLPLLAGCHEDLGGVVEVN